MNAPRPAFLILDVSILRLTVLLTLEGIAVDVDILKK
jgi:hypothetical protein